MIVCACLVEVLMGPTELQAQMCDHITDWLTVCITEKFCCIQNNHELGAPSELSCKSEREKNFLDASS